MNKQRLSYFREYYKTHKDKYKYRYRPPESVTPRRRFGKYGRNAKLRGYTFTLLLEEFVDLIKQPCFYCGDEGKPYNGIDRKNNSIGYEIENSVACCTMCNKMKRSFPFDEFIEKCIKIAKKIG